jgi:hypothetical protein
MGLKCSAVLHWTASLVHSAVPAAARGTCVATVQALLCSYKPPQLDGPIV